ncbi:PepSY-associated TM helix domain-containing protein [Pirellulaceae bacterium SH449]
MDSVQQGSEAAYQSVADRSVDQEWIGGASHIKPRSKPNPKNGPVKRSLAKAFRWVHLYVSLLGFASLMFFAWTGITLNHPAWFGASTPTLRDQEGKLEIDLLTAPIDRLMLAEELRDRHRLRGKVARFEESELDIMVVFKSPGYAADVFIDRATGTYTVSETAHGITSIMNDLHKGRDSGEAWSWLIDVSAIVMMVMSLSGFGLLFYMKKKRAVGLLVAVIGTVAMLAVWIAGVP